MALYGVSIQRLYGCMAYTQCLNTVCHHVCALYGPHTTKKWCVVGRWSWGRSVGVRTHSDLPMALVCHTTPQLLHMTLIHRPAHRRDVPLRVCKQSNEQAAKNSAVDGFEAGHACIWQADFGARQGDVVWDNVPYLPRVHGIHHITKTYTFGPPIRIQEFELCQDS